MLRKREAEPEVPPKNCQPREKRQPITPSRSLLVPGGTFAALGAAVRCTKRYRIRLMPSARLMAGRSCLGFSGRARIMDSWKQARSATRHDDGLKGLRAKFLQDAFTQKIGIVLAGLGKFDDAPRDDFVGEIAPVRKAKRRANHFECHPHDAPSLGVKRHSAQVRSYRHGAPLQSQAGARPVSQPSAPDRGSLPMIGLSYAAYTRGQSPSRLNRAKIIGRCSLEIQTEPTGVEPVQDQPPPSRSAVVSVRASFGLSRQSRARGVDANDGWRSALSSAAAADADSYRFAALSHESRNLRKSARVSLSVASCARAAHSAAFCRQYPIFCHMTLSPFGARLGSRASPLEAWRANSPNAPSSQVRRGALGSSE